MDYDEKDFELTKKALKILNPDSKINQETKVEDVIFISTRAKEILEYIAKSPSPEERFACTCATISMLLLNHDQTERFIVLAEVAEKTSNQNMEKVFNEMQMVKDFISTEKAKEMKK